MSTPALPVLVGQFDSPYVRRVAVSMNHLGMPFAHRPWSVGRDQLRIRQINPVGRVPVLLLPGGEALIESAMILDYLDELAGDARRLVPAAGPARRAVHDWLALSSAAIDKGIQIVYEHIFKPVEKLHQPFLARCMEQTSGALAELDRRCAAVGDAPWLVGDAISQADITLACFATYLREAVPFDLSAMPALRARVARLEALPLFAASYAPFDPPVPTAPAASASTPASGGSP
jgi:glutathione S-transferase